MILGENLTFQTSSGKEILSNVSLSIDSGTMAGIIGKNGAGKSTLIKLLAGLDQPSQGEVKIDDRELEDFSERELAVKRSVLSQEVPVSFGLSVLDILLMGRYPHARRVTTEDYKKVDFVIESLDLGGGLKTSYPSLSGGERQKVQFGRALCQLLPLEKDCRKVLFLDEPLAALDLSVQQLILRRIRSFVDDYGLTVVFVLHDLNYISRHCDKVFLLEKGQCMLHGSPKDVFTVDHLYRYFDVNVQLIKGAENRPHMIFN